MKQLNILFKAFCTKLLMLLFFFTLLPTMASAQCPDNNHPHMIDLGLPSGTKWACCNVGASKPEDCGGYYAWGETEEKDVYNWSTYEYGTYNYNYDTSNLVDIGSDIQGTQYDVAHAKWGGEWVMPSMEQIQELVKNCSYEWVTQNGVDGGRFTGPNDASVFLPAANNLAAGITFSSVAGCYWASSIRESHTFEALGLSFADNAAFDNFFDYRYVGNSVRPVASSIPSGIAIDENNFPDENFRNWVLAQDYGQDGVLTDEEIAAVTIMFVDYENIANLKGVEYFSALTVLVCGLNQLTSLDVSKNIALEWLDCQSCLLTSLDVSKNTALIDLNCDENQLTSLDVSQNTALEYLHCQNNQLTSLNLSKNTILTSLNCDTNQLTSLDVSKNTALTSLWCQNNQLTSLDVSKNTKLTDIYAGRNQLTSLDVTNNTTLKELSCQGNQLTTLYVSKNSALSYLNCNSNKIRGTAMDALIAGLPETGGNFYAIILDDSYEQNVVTKAQVAAAKEKGWTVYAYDENVGDWGEWVEYDGDEPKEITPVEQGETINIGTEIDASTNLDGNVVGDVYYCISSDSGSYDPEEGCLVVTKPTDDSAIDGKDIFGEDFKDGYTGFVFMVAPGKGTINVEAETTGNMVLKVRVGDNAPTQMEVDGKTKVSFSYDVSEPTMVFIYGSIAAAGAKGVMKAAGTDALKIYGIEVTSTNGIEAIDNGQLTIDNSPVYNLNGQRVESSKLKVQNSKLPKGVYIQNGKKVLVK